MPIRALLVVVMPIWASAAPPDFEREVAPILARRCAGCHNASEARGDLDITEREKILQGGSKGPALSPGKLDESILIERVVAGEMPPKEKGKSQKLPDAEIATLRAWVADGAPWPKGRVVSPYERTTEVRGGFDWWSLQPVRRQKLPEIRNAKFEIRNSIDVFVLAKLQSAGLEPAPEAERRTLVRRLYFDVIGLPPSPEEIEEIGNDKSPDWYEKLVDRLLADPRHGERWARFWLDLVRYAETNGYERDALKPFAWKYRDYVIRALNQDKPYDRFILEQLAGDELADSSEETVVATSLLRVGTWDDEPNDKLEYKYDRLEDMVHVVTTSFLGLTVKCARCHDHKFDPLPQTDYYRVASAFWPGDLLGNPGGKVLGFDALGWTDVSAKPAPLHLLKKGDPRKPGQAIEPGFLKCLPALDTAFAPPGTEAKSTGRRSQLAKRIADPQNPLTSRVLVNRLWQQHFGQGLVRTPDNFGFKGDVPSHPELLDWLATEVVEGGWKIKPLHRLMLLSQTYRQASVHPQEETYRQKDSANRLLWRMSRRRLEAEALRDNLLAVAGRLSGAMGGPSFTPRVSKEALEGLSRKTAAWQESTPDEQRRRSIYLLSKRSLILPLMTTFDFADPTRPCAQRDVTTVAPQALTLLNNEFTHEQSAALAARVVSSSDPIKRAWLLALGRAPRESERTAARGHLEVQEKTLGSRERALTSLCHVLMNSNEFIYID